MAPDLPGQGYEGHPARRARLEHQALSHVFFYFDARTAQAQKVAWGGKTVLVRDTKIYLGAVIVDHPQLDKFTGCPGGKIYQYEMLCDD